MRTAKLEKMIVVCIRVRVPFLCIDFQIRPMACVARLLLFVLSTVNGIVRFGALRFSCRADKREVDESVAHNYFLKNEIFVYALYSNTNIHRTSILNKNQCASNKKLVLLLS